jgi:ABC-type nitrate/sulfonate/bicarbonate transport system permease component
MEKTMMNSKNIILSEAEKKAIRYNRFCGILPVISIALLILLWMVVANKESARFPSPPETWERFTMLMEKPIKGLNIFGHAWASLKRVFAALVIAWILGISFGILIGWNKKCNALFTPMFTAFRSVPPLAWIPLITIWFGTGENSKILVVFIGCIASIVVNTQAGMSNVNQLYLDVGTIFNANDRQKLFQIAIPSALDAIFAGVRTSTSAAWMVVLAAEMLGGKSGVGFLIVRGMDSLDLPLVLLSMICIGLVGAILAIVTQIAERMICPWTRRKSD